MAAGAATTTASGSVTAMTIQGRENAGMPDDPREPGLLLGSDQDPQEQDRVNPKDLPADEDDLPADGLSDAEDEENTDLPSPE